jgi:hypothetical protein
MKREKNMTRTIKAIERHMVLASSRIAYQSNSNNPTANRHAGLQDESGGTQWKQRFQLPAFRAAAVAVAKC